jgi:galacturonosyltransferase
MEVIKALIDAGYEVHISCPREGKVQAIEELGCKIIDTPVDRRGRNPLKDFLLLVRYLRMIHKNTPDVVLTYTIKPNLYGGLACSCFNVPYIENITGISEVMYENGFFHKLLLKVNRLSLRKASVVFFQNQDNLRAYIQHSLVHKGICKIIPGSGVNLQKFPLLEYPTGDEKCIRLLFIGRIIQDKGVKELLSVVKSLVAEGYSLTCDFAGILVDTKFLPMFADYSNVGAGTYLGVSSDISGLLQDYHAVILPSYHEGMANVLLEASASGRPVLASNIPGCKETFIEGVSGLGFVPKNEESLRSTILKFISLDIEVMRLMGLAGRKLVRESFSRQIVVDAYLEEIKKLLSEKKKKKDRKR